MQRTKNTKQSPRLRRVTFRSELRKNWILFCMLLPAVLYVFVFNYLPMPGMVIAFKNYDYGKGIFGSDWVGLNNFGYLFKTGVIKRVTLNTVVYNVLFIAFDLIVQVGIAVFLSETVGKKSKRFLKRCFCCRILFPGLLPVQLYIIFSAQIMV